MIDWQQISSAFLIAFLGGSHCVMMCGGIVSAISMQQPGMPPSFKRSLFYNLGRISSYTLAGLIFGGIGFAVLQIADIKPLQMGLAVFAALILLLLGLYIAGWLNWIIKVEQLGSVFWRWIQPFGKRWLPIQKDSHAFMVGMIWGWLPCGLVYSVLIWALSSGSAFNGAMIMLAFGLGTLPNLLAMGVFANKLSELAQKNWLRKTAGVFIILVALIQLIRIAANRF